LRLWRPGDANALAEIVNRSRSAFEDWLPNVRSAAVARKAGFTHVTTVDLDRTLPRTAAQTGREMTWIRRPRTTTNDRPGQ